MTHIRDTIAALPSAWRTKAAELRELEAAGQAAGLELAARQLESALREQADETLTLGQAAEVSGYSPETLRKLIAAGELPQAGRKGAPRVRRGDLPRRARGAARPNAYDADADAVALLGRLKAS